MKSFVTKICRWIVDASSGRSMVDSENVRAKLLNAALDAYREEYAELHETWRSIDTKAQGNVAIAGIFLAGLFAFVEHIDSNAICWQKTLLVLSGCALSLSVLSAVLVLMVRTRESPRVGQNVEMLAKDLLKLSDEDLPSRFAAFVSDQITVWKNSVNKLDEIVQRKANKLKWAQILLALGVVSIAIMTVLNIVMT